MEWLDNLFKLQEGAGNGIIGNYTGNRGHNPNTQAWNRGKKSWNEALEGHGELNRDITLPLLKEDRRKGKGYDADEHLSRALKESLYLYARLPQSILLPLQRGPTGQRICRGCNKEIGMERYIRCMGWNWHPQCFCCKICGAPITDQEFSTVANHPYHKNCYRQQFYPKCHVCNDFIPTNRGGVIEYRIHPFWRAKYCPKHETESTPLCCSCERIQSKDVLYVALEDGRKLCLECLQTSIMDTGECQPLYHEIRDFYEGLNMKISQQVPMLLVERHALNEAIEGEKNVPYHNLPETRGLCLSEEQTVNAIVTRPRVFGNRLIGMRTARTRLIRHCEVTAILVLYGLPRLLTGSILAHELMHAWLHLNEFGKLRMDVEEGICQVLAHMWLESEVVGGSSTLPSFSSSKQSKAPKTSMEKKLGEFFLYQIAKDQSPIYGDGFRLGHASVTQFGLRRTLEHIKITGGFPL